MKNNNDQTDALRKDGQIIDRAQNRLKKERLSILRKAKKGGWRAVAERRGVNVRYVYELAVRGIAPRNPETRRKLGLPRVMPSERKPKAKEKAAVRSVLAQAGLELRNDEKDACIQLALFDLDSGLPDERGASRVQQRGGDG